MQMTGSSRCFSPPNVLSKALLLMTIIAASLGCTPEEDSPETQNSMKILVNGRQLSEKEFTQASASELMQAVRYVCRAFGLISTSRSKTIETDKNASVSTNEVTTSGSIMNLQSLLITEKGDYMESLQNNGFETERLTKSTDLATRFIVRGELLLIQERFSEEGGIFREKKERVSIKYDDSADDTTCTTTEIVRTP